VVEITSSGPSASDSRTRSSARRCGCSASNSTSGVALGLFAQAADVLRERLERPVAEVVGIQQQVVLIQVRQRHELADRGPTLHREDEQVPLDVMLNAAASCVPAAHVPLAPILRQRVRIDAASQIDADHRRFGPDVPWGFADPAGWKCSPRYCDQDAACPGGGGL
jgi:hypothetical protein